MVGFLSFLGPIVGGLLGQNSERKAIEAQNAYNHPTLIRQRAEEAGFNPLLFVGPGVGNQTAVGGSNFMGEAISKSMLALSDDMERKEEMAQIERLTAENRDLMKRVEGATLRPPSATMYERIGATPNLLASLGERDGSGYGLGAASVSHSKLPLGLSYGGISGAVRSDTSDAETFETRYGDIVQSVAGLGILAADVGTWTARTLDRARWEAETKKRQDRIDNPVYSGRGSYGMPEPWLLPGVPSQW